jgi:UDP-sugar transporter A1/2/3
MGAKPAGFGLMLLGFLVFQNTFTVLLARYTRTVYVYEISHMLIMAETMKFVASFCLEQYITGNVFQSLKQHNYETPVNALALSIPALLYFCSNTLVYVAISNLAVPLFQIVSQTKLVTTAILSLFLLKRSYSWIQWGSILALCAGVTVCILGQQKGNDKASSEAIASSISIYGLTAVAISNVCGSLAGVYFEKVIKKIPTNDFITPPSLWMRNMQLAFFTMVIAICQQVAEKGGNAAGASFFSGFAPLLWLQIGCFAIGGLLVASVVQYTDSVQKGLATGVSVVLSSIMSSLIDHTSDAFTWTFAVGSTLAIGGCFCFGNATTVSACLTMKNLSKSKRKVVFVIPFLGIATYFTLAAQYFPIAVPISAQQDMPTIITDLINVTAQYLPIAVPTADPTAAPIADPTTAPTAAPILAEQDTGVPSAITDFTNMKNEMTFHIYGLPKAADDCGGCKCLVELRESLNDLGFSTTTGWHCPKQTVAINATLVIVYPEVVEKRCLGPGNRVHVRWMLAPLGVVKITKSAVTGRTWGLDDIVSNYATSTGDNVPVSNILQVFPNPRKGDVTDISDAAFYNSTGRNGIAWMMRKGPKFHKNINFIHEHDGFHVTEVNKKKKDAFKPEYFRNYEYFVSYDPYTYWSWYAAMLGTVSVVYPLANQTKEEWALGTFIGSYLLDTNSTKIPGVAYGWSDSELEYARRTMHDLRGLLVKVRQWGVDTTVTRFTRDCYRYSLGERKHFEGAMLFRDAYADYIANDYKKL